jgi:hypothetical protein
MADSVARKRRFNAYLTQGCDQIATPRQTFGAQSHDQVIARVAGFDYQPERPVAMGSLRRILPAAHH